MTISLLVTYALALAVAALIPGPGITALVGRALSQGMTSALFMAVGLVAGDTTWLTFVVFGLSAIAKNFAIVLVAIKYLGAAYLIYVAWKIWTAGIMKAEDAAAPPMPLWQSTVSGYLLTIGNPKVMLFYGGLVPNLVPLEKLGIADYLLLLATTFGVLLIVLLPYIALAAKARDLIRNEVALKRLNRSAASIIAGTAVWIVARA